MNVRLTVRKRTKIDGISGISTSVTLLCDLQLWGADRGQVEVQIPTSEYETFEPGSIWCAELVKQ